MRQLLAFWRVVRGLWHLAAGLWLVHGRMPRLGTEQREQIVQAWALQLLALWGIHLKVLGQPVPVGPVLLVSNHISWLDILVIHAARYCRFVSKSDIRQWPVVGSLAAGSGTLFIERSQRKDALRMVKDMTQALRDGDVLAIFPEGTTSDGRALLPFHANLIQSAIAAEVLVQPIAIAFVDARSGRPTQAPGFVGDDTLVASIWRTLTAPPITAVVSFGEPQTANGRDRRQWAHDLREAVSALRQQA